MILDIDKWYLGYNQILQDCIHNDGGIPGSALLLCNADVDAMAAARIVAYMLRKDGVSYQLLPCMGVQQLESRLVGSVDHLRSVILFNIGASRNLTKLFHNGLNPSVKIFVMDCRRPVHLANFHAGKEVVLFWDQQSDVDVPSDGDNLSGNESSSDEESEESSDEDDDDDDEDSEEENEFEGEATKKQKVDANVESDKENDMAETETEDSPKDATEDSQEKTQEPTATQMTARELNEDRRSRLKTYYAGGSFFGSPAAFVAYQIASQLRFHQMGSLLWLACVGVTDAYLNSRIDVSGYSALALELKTQCSNLFPNDEYERVKNTVYAEHLNGQQSGTGDAQLTKLSLSNKGRILAESDYRFFLLRYSSLFDAMMYSDYVSSRLQLQSAKGMHKLKEMLAKMGFPLEQCMQPYVYMKPKLRRALRSKMEEFGEEYGLDDFEFTSFFKITGYQSLLSAADTSHAATSLLESVDPIAGNDDEALMKSFNIAFDALEADAPTQGFQSAAGGDGLVNGGALSGNIGLGAGIRHAMSLQRKIVNTAANLIESNSITRLSHFRYAYLMATKSQSAQGSRRSSSTGTNQDHAEDMNTWARPLALCRLAHYLMNLNRENGKWTGPKARPLVLLAEKPNTGMFLVAGYEFPEQQGDSVRNKFGKHFQLAAQSMDGKFRFDSFESNVLEVSEKDSQRFMEQLHYLLEMTTEN